MESGKAGDPAKGIEEILSSLRSAEDEAGKAAPPGGAESRRAGLHGGYGDARPRGKGPAVPSRGGGVEGQGPEFGPASGAPGGELKEFLMRRIEALEKGLAAERERASAAESRSARQEANRGEVEEQLRSISDLLKRERDESHSRGRIEALEARLDKMHETWAATLERLASRPEPGTAGKELAGVRARLDGLAAKLEDFMKRGEARSAGAALLAGRLEALEKRFGEMSGGLAAVVDKAASRQEASSKAAAEELAHVREWVQKLAGIFTESMDGMGKEVERTRAEMGVIVKRLYEAGLTVEAAERRLADLIRRGR